MNAFSKSLRSARLSAGLTQEQLGFEVGVTKASVSAWENAREFPSFTVLLRLREVLDMSLDALVGEAGAVDDASARGAIGRAQNTREQLLLQRFRSLSGRRQDAFLEAMRADD
ncbi:helix-turn-helix transcriptional regulator [Stutzerimonas kirkiae]|uniref:XRE family transcriptional regulator n=1 Tax=Stutzerimonas kirkiae TaxID=2211392 RepID=A0A4Q9RF40_9GAMM|nr:helix-turn-helix transcriptional regulator [Stutzerimonas kirkiae]TBU98931.1 XRE family transcriptional regulator [Stutzerimonas kirkiae]TBV01581.1 XRE family transcriptional regulator [Stutzerimonas kirkiae]TBV10316.1 XRE family transcriptional regulator [Stutzerimonas kirkiae]TBV16891.1 XRE family transcriptional regulator [Stutzerimonas kirkiae]